MWQLLKQDAARWIIPEEIADVRLITPPTLLRLLWNYLGLRAMFWARLGGWCSARRIPLVKGLIYRRLHRRFGLEISFDKPIGGGLYIAHTQGCVIAVEAIGDNCTIIAAVTLGRRNKHEFPVLGNRVLLGTGVRVLGGVTIGDGARIGANAVVIDDVPPGATAVGIPARIIRRAPLVNSTLNGNS